MKKYLFILILLFFFSFGFKVEAKIVPFTSDQTVVNLTDDLQLEIINIDKTSKNWVLDLSEQAETNTWALQIYPSQKALEYKLVAKNAQALTYRNFDNTGDWKSQTLLKDKKVLVKLSESSTTTSPEILTPDNLLELDNRTFSKSSKSDDNLVLVESSQTLEVAKAMAPLEQENLLRISKLYQIKTSGDYNLKFFYTENDFRAKDIYYYDLSQQMWIKLDGYNDVKEKFIKAELRLAQENLIVAIFANPAQQDGIASYYDQSRYKYFNYQNGNFAASRDYPKGTKLKVTRLKTGQSIIVQVNDYGPELQTGRVIDLDTSAFKQLSSLGAGLIYVKVELYD
ncbi:hypothetical protein KBC40_00110 [Patescibacteria group bacterium]|nr:hypothetical protein [Patescibacteria group bacterium]